MAKRMLVVRNPKAGSFLSQNTFLEAAGVIFKDESFNVYVYTTTGRGDATRIAREEGPGVDRIVAFGGDGTLTEVINGVMHLPAKDRPELGYIPAGTTNDFASGVGLSRNIVKAAQTVLTGIPEPLDVGRFGEERYLHQGQLLRLPGPEERPGLRGLPAGGAPLPHRHPLHSPGGHGGRDHL